MNRRDALRNARAEFDAIGIEGWRIVLDSRPTRRLGQTRYARREVGLSAKFIDLNGWEVVRVTVRHEAAHVLAGPNTGHGPVWRAHARALGVPTSWANRDQTVIMPQTGIDIICPTHGRIGGRTRMPRAGARYRHNGCGETVSFKQVRRG